MSDGRRDDGVRGDVQETHPTVVLCTDGPMLLRGDHVVQDADGALHRTTRPISAVCRCGKSASQPWCDGTHKLIPNKRGQSRRDPVERG